MSSPAPAPITCTVFPVAPSFTSTRERGVAKQEKNQILLENSHVKVVIAARTGVIVGIENKQTAERHAIGGDRVGVALTPKGGAKTVWVADEVTEHTFNVHTDTAPDGTVSAILATMVAEIPLSLSYRLGADDFWVERRLVLTAPPAVYEKLIYGAANVAGGNVHELKLGKFDAPRLISAGEGGVFAGVGWWYYDVRDGVYQNTDMNFETQGRFEAEPWYLGIFRPEPGEPYPGWLWYKTFLEQRKLSYDKQRSYVLWNARSGYSFNPINNADLLSFVETASLVGLSGLTTGEVRGLANGTKLAAEDATARRVIDTFANRGVEFGLHEGDVKADHWRTDAGLARKIQAVDDAAAQGIRNLTIDFFSVKDAFPDHYRVAKFFRHIRERMSYTECHLGMAAYGPQFQREVLINHPADLKGFEISRFSSDWSTLMGFRKSRREWQQRYQYLMPENGLFYFSTHYSNYPRRYEEPERQQFLYIADAWRGLAYAFHDKFGFRDSVAAQAAFSTFTVFGFMDAHIPREDGEFARDFFRWVKANVDVLNRARVCLETEEVLVMSKVRNGRGAIFAINYRPGKKRFQLKPEFGPAVKGATRIRQIYPSRGDTRLIPAGDSFEFEVAGERLAIFEVNGGLNGLPPENPGQFPIDIADWRRTGDGFSGTVVLPDIRAALTRRKDDSLPRLVASADQVETEVVVKKPAGRSMGALPREFLAAYEFIDDKSIPTWKAAPWAFADRVWLVYVPAVAPTIVEKKPTLRVNGKELTLTPRVAYLPRTRVTDPHKWTVPLWFADVTDVCRFGGANEISLGGIKNAALGAVFLAAAPEQ